MDGVNKLEDLRGRLAGLSRLLGGADGEPIAAQALPHMVLDLKPQSKSARSPSPPKSAPSSRPATFKAVIPPSKSVLRSTNAQSSTAMGSALANFKEEEAKWLQQKGELQMMLNKEKKKSLKLEAELKRVQDMHQYRVGEVKHLKGALKQRDDHVMELQDRIRELEIGTAAEKLAKEAVQHAEAERDELRDAMQQMLQRLSHTNEIIAHTDQTIGDMEAKVHAMDIDRQQAVEQAAAATADAASLRETIKELEWKCSMLQQLADMTLQQNEEKMNALRQLLQSESLLDAGVGDATSEALSEFGTSLADNATDSSPGSP